MTLDARVDARELDSQELFLKLNDILSSKWGKDVFIEILIDTFTATKKVKAYISMTGCKTEIEKKEGYYIVRVTGTPCCV